MQALIVNVLLTYELWDNHTAHCRFCNGHVRSLQTLYNAIVQPPARHWLLLVSTWRERFHIYHVLLVLGSFCDDWFWIGWGLGFDRYFGENGWPSSKIFETPPSTDSDKEKLVDIIQVCLLYLWFYNMLDCSLISLLRCRIGSQILWAIH
jgi:hypothetical protein